MFDICIESRQNHFTLLNVVTDEKELERKLFHWRRCCFLLCFRVALQANLFRIKSKMLMAMRYYIQDTVWWFFLFQRTQYSIRHTAYSIPIQNGSIAREREKAKMNNRNKRNFMRFMLSQLAMDRWNVCTIMINTTQNWFTSWWALISNKIKEARKHQHNKK